MVEEAAPLLKQAGKYDDGVVGLLMLLFLLPVFQATVTLGAIERFGVFSVVVAAVLLLPWHPGRLGD